MEPDYVLEQLPETFLNEDDMELLDRLFDRVAAESRWSNRDVAHAFCKLIHMIVGDRDGRG